MMRFQIRLEIVAAMSTAVLVLVLLGTFFIAVAPFTDPSRQSGVVEKKLNSVLKLDVGKLVIDTDAGGDDAGAILLALGEGALLSQVKVVAVTCVHGNTNVDNVVANVLKTLDTVNRLDIPVYRGASKTIHLTPKEDYFFGLDGFGDFEYPNSPDPEEYLQKEHAVQALINIVAESPGEVTVLCIGPLTNIALAIRLDPLFLANVGQLVVLGGSVEGMGNVLPGIEFNFFTDPEASFIVFNSTDTSVASIKPIILFPWESVAKRHTIPIEWRLNVLGEINSPQVRLLNQAERAILNAATYQTGDALAAAVTVRASIVQETTAAYMHVQHYGENGGAVFVDYQDSLSRPRNVIIIQSLDVETFKSMFVTNLS